MGKRAPLPPLSNMLFRPPPLDWGGTNPPPPGVSSFASAVNSVISLAHRVSSRRAGIVIAGIAIVFSAPDATLLRCLQQDGTPNSTIFLWKMAVYTVVQAAFAIQQDGSLRRVLRLTCDSWPWMLIGSLALCVEWFATLANLTTSSASALCLFYIAPLWAVPMGMLVNSDALHARTLVAMAVALIGILLIFAPNVLSSTTGKPHPVAHIRPLRHGQHRNDSSLSGDLCGLASGLAFAAWITTCRHAVACMGRPRRGADIGRVGWRWAARRRVGRARDYRGAAAGCARRFAGCRDGPTLAEEPPEELGREPGGDEWQSRREHAAALWGE